MDTSLFIACLSGVAIAAACGLRAFLPLLLLGIAGRLGIIELRESVAWLSSVHALWSLGIATALELLGDKIPVVDHALDAVGTVLRPAAAVTGSLAVLAAWPTPWAQIAALVLGAGALAVHGLKSHVRLGSSALTLGSANPLVSLVEDALAIAGVALALFLPLLVLLVVLVLIAAAAQRSSTSRSVARARASRSSQT